VKTLNLISDSPIEVSSNVENDKSEKKDEKNNIASDRFIRIKNIKIPPRPPPRKKSLKYIVNTSSDKDAPLKRSRRNSHARKAPRKSL
jgi:hypothetical protein